MGMILVMRMFGGFELMVVGILGWPGSIISMVILFVGMGLICMTTHTSQSVMGLMGVMV